MRPRVAWLVAGAALVGACSLLPTDDLSREYAATSSGDASSSSSTGGGEGGAPGTGGEGGCPFGTADCGSGACVDLTASATNCGACGEACGDGACRSGSCRRAEQTDGLASVRLELRGTTVYASDAFLCLAPQLWSVEDGTDPVVTQLTQALQTPLVESFAFVGDNQNFDIFYTGQIPVGPPDNVHWGLFRLESPVVKLWEGNTPAVVGSLAPVVISNNIVVWSDQTQMLKATLNTDMTMLTGSPEIFQTTSVPIPHMKLDGIAEVVWSDVATISKKLIIANDGTMPTVLVQQAGIGDFAIDTTHIAFFTGDGGIYLATKGSAAPPEQLFAPDMRAPGGIAMNATHVYWTVVGNTGTDLPGELRRVNRTTGRVELLARGRQKNGSSDTEVFADLALGQSRVYWGTIRGNCAPGGINRRALGAYPIEVLVP